MSTATDLHFDPMYPTEPVQQEREHFQQHSSADSSWRPAAAAVRPQQTNGTTKEPPTLDPSILPSGKKSLAGISIRAFLLGVGLGIFASLTITLVIQRIALWRISFFVSTLCLFHFLEYYVTARYNTWYASVSAFLLSSNGWAYNVAHGSAVLECLLSHLLAPAGYSTWTASIIGTHVPLIIGLVLMIIGQTVRTLAMAQAGSNFNHTVQVEHKEGHTLVTGRIYALLRHPSYFGFFWWGLGTQLVLQNVLCFCAYAFVLWQFFDSRIKQEERFLIHFFGENYVQYKKKTRVGIPGIS